MPDTECADRTRFVRLAAAIALAGNLALAIAKITVGGATGSLAVIGDGIDSSTDVLIAIMSLAIGFYMNRPSDKEHPWGHGRSETLGTMVLSFIILFAGTQLFGSALSQIRNPSDLVLPSPLALAITLVSIAGKAGLAASQYILGKKSGSAMILANAKNMTNDIIISVSVFAGLGLSLLLRNPILDSVTALAVSLWVMKSGITIFREQNMELMDGNADTGLYRDLFDAVRSVEGAGNPHRARIRKMAARWDIDLDIEVPGSLSVTRAHEIAQKVEYAIRCAIPDVYDIMVHIEPAGFGEHDTEQYGLTAHDVQDE